MVVGIPVGSVMRTGGIEVSATGDTAADLREEIGILRISNKWLADRFAEPLPEEADCCAATGSGVCGDGANPAAAAGEGGEDMELYCRLAGRTPDGGTVNLASQASKTSRKVVCVSSES
jgi:hypothetical protein